jgi:hypothetical protein
MDAIRDLNRNKKSDRHGLIGLVLLGLMLWGAYSLWGSSEARCGQVIFERLTSGTTTIEHHPGTSTPGPAKITHPPDRIHTTGATSDASAPFEAPRDGANNHIDNRRHPFHATTRDRSFVALLLLLANLRN